MKELLLLRHAKSSWDNVNLGDINRPLNEKGQADAPLMGEQIANLNFIPQIIFSSTAQRTRETIALVCETAHLPMEKVSYETELYTFDFEDVLRFIVSISDEFERVMMVGHNPAYTFLFNFLSDDTIENLPTCGACLLRFDVEKWADLKHKKGETLWIGSPRMFYP
jgi:phosphohistidine phosphatase